MTTAQKIQALQSIKTGKATELQQPKTQMELKIQALQDFKLGKIKELPKF